MKPSPLRHLTSALADLERDGLLRQRQPPWAPAALSFCSNDYLGLAGSTAPPVSTGAGASRLVSGERHEHQALERALSDWLHTEDSLLFTSGYAANVGALSALIGPGDLVVSDRLNHASIIDGIRLGHGEVIVTPHLEVAAVSAALRRPRRGRAWVVTESYFSMDADSPDLAALRALCDEADAALVVDEAHALGVAGPGGRGVAAQVGVRPDVLVGTLGKALGAGGAFVSGSRDLIHWLWNRARTFVFSTGVPPMSAAAALSALTSLRANSDLQARLSFAAASFRAGLQGLGISPIGWGPIVPWVIGDPRRAVAIAAQLRARGVHVQAIRPPSVPQGTARIRFTVTARHTADDIGLALSAIREVLGSLELP